MELTRRTLLGTLAVGTTGASAYYLMEGSGDDCRSTREPTWEVSGRGWTRPVEGPNGVLAAEDFTATGGRGLNRVGSFQNGDARWVYNVEGDGVGVPFADEDLVAVGTGSDRVHAFDQPTGHHRWTYDAGGEEEYGGGAWGQPRHVDGAVIVAVSHAEESGVEPTNVDAFTHRLLALEDGDGSVRWQSPLDGVAFTGPVVHDDTVVVATEQGGVHGVALSSGERRWRDSVPGEVWAPLCHDPDHGTVFVTSDAGAVVAFDAPTGERQWSRTFDSGVVGTALADGRLFVATWDGRAVALEAGGETAWRVDLGEAGGPVDAADGLVGVFDQTGVVHVLAEEGGVLSRFGTAEGYGDQCGWRPKLNAASGIQLDEFSATLSSRSWVAEFDLDVE